MGVTLETVIPTLENGQNKQYEIKLKFNFIVEGKSVAASELKRRICRFSIPAGRPCYGTIPTTVQLAVTESPASGYGGWL